MTDRKEISNQPPVHDYRVTVLNYLLDEQQKDPQLTNLLVKRLWEALPVEEQEARYNLTGGFYAAEDFKGRNNLICSQLLLEFVSKEANLAHDLDQQFTNPPPPSPETTA